MNITDAAAHQYRSVLAMLGKAIELCPEDLWLAGAPNRYWHIAYHALFYTHFYLAHSDTDFVPWRHHRAEYNFLGELPLKPGYKPQINQPYTQQELLEYHAFCLQEIEKQLPNLDTGAPSGFYWLPFTKLELQFYSIRHIAHHTGQLADRLRSQANVGVPWVR